MTEKRKKYNEIFRKDKNRVYGYAFYLLKNQMDAEDVTQEVFIRLWNNWGKFKMSKITAWLMTTTRNLCLDYLRRRKNVSNNEIQIPYFLESENAYGNPAMIFELRADYEQVNNAVLNLPETLKSVFVLYEIQKFKYREISKMLNIPINSVKVYLYRARKKIREEIKINEQTEIKEY